MPAAAFVVMSSSARGSCLLFDSAGVSVTKQRRPTSPRVSLFKTTEVPYGFYRKICLIFCEFFWVCKVSIYVIQLPIFVIQYLRIRFWTGNTKYFTQFIFGGHSTIYIILCSKLGGQKSSNSCRRSLWILPNKINLKYLKLSVARSKDFKSDCQDCSVLFYFNSMFLISWD